MLSVRVPDLPSVWAMRDWNATGECCLGIFKGAITSVILIPITIIGITPTSTHIPNERSQFWNIPSFKQVTCSCRAVSYLGTVQQGFSYHVLGDTLTSSTAPTEGFPIWKSSLVILTGFNTNLPLNGGPIREVRSGRQRTVGVK